MVLAQKFGLLCEGYAGSFTPEVAYVKQGQKVLFFWGSRQLTEALESGAQIVESLSDFDLEERTVDGQTIQYPKGGVWVVEGPYQRSDIENANKRKYKKKIWERLVGDPNSPVQRAMKEGGGLVGHLEHPADGRMDGAKGAIVTRSLKLREDGVVWGRSELLDTPHGLILQEYTKKKIRWGVSSRGNGSVDDNGNVGVDDYMLETFDAVMKPSTPGAYPKLVTTGIKTMTPKESADPKPEHGQVTEDVESCEAEVKALAETSLDTLDEDSRAAFAGRLLNALSAVNDLAKSDALPSARANELQGWLAQKLKDIHDGTTARVEEAFDKACRDLEASGGDEAMREAAVRRLVSTFERRVSEAVGEAEGLRARMAQSESLVEEQAEYAAAVEAERNIALTLLNEAQRKLAAMKKQFDAACDAISERSSVDTRAGITEAVDEAIRQVPELVDYRSTLEEAVSPEDVEEVAESLIPTVIEARRSRPVEPSSNTRLTLPSGVVESVASSVSRTAGTNPSTGARLVGKAIKK
jgi:hypothetical protein